MCVCVYIFELIITIKAFIGGPTGLDWTGLDWTGVTFDIKITNVHAYYV